MTRRIPSEQADLRAELDRIRRLSDLANRANMNGGFARGMPTPIPARCSNSRCGFHWTGRDAIRAPSLTNVRCFWCGAELHALAAEPQAEMFPEVAP